MTPVAISGKQQAEGSRAEKEMIVLDGDCLGIKSLP